MRSFSSQLDAYVNNQNYYASAVRVNSLQTLPFNQEIILVANESVINPFGAYNSTTGRFTAPTDMTLCVSFFVTYVGLTPTVGNVQVRYSLNGSLNTFPYSGSRVTSDEQTQTGVFLLQLSAGDYVNIVANQTSTNPTATVGFAFYFSKV